MSGRTLDESMDRLDGLLRKAESITSGSRTNATGNATVHVNAGGVAVWVAATACAVCMAVLIVGAVFVSVWMADQSREIQELRQNDDVLQAYINAGYLNEGDATE